MVIKTAIISLVSTLVIAVLAFSSERSGGDSRRGVGTAAVTGASGSWSGGGQRGNWGGNIAGVTGASGSWSGGGQRGNWGGGRHEGGGSDGGDD